MLLYFVDAIQPAEVAVLKGQGHRCVIAASSDQATLRHNMATAEVLIVRSTTVTREMMEAGPNLGLIIRAGAGTDTIDVDAASEFGIYVCNVPGQNAVAVAELTLGLVLALDRGITQSTNDLKGSYWNKAKYSDASGLKGRNIGILGFGSIGYEVAVRAKAFGLSIHGLQSQDRTPSASVAISDLDATLHESIEDLLTVADIVSLHLPLTPQTQHLVNKHFLSNMKVGATLVNTARGGLVDEHALLEAMTTKGLRVGLDVYEAEPVEAKTMWGPTIAQMDNFVGSHHIGASTEQARTAVARGVVSTINAYETGVPPNCVNIAARPLGECAVAVRHKDEVGVLAAILSCLGTAGLNVQQMRNEIFEGTGVAAAVATIRVSQMPRHTTVTQLEAIPSVIKVDVLSSS